MWDLTEKFGFWCVEGFGGIFELMNNKILFIDD